MKKQYISPNLQVHFLQIEGGMLCGSIDIDIVNNGNNVITDSGNNSESGAWTNQKEASDYWED